MRAFGRTGYFGTSTAEIAREAGISQGYVLHLFGTKQELFLAAVKRTGEVILAQMRGIGLEEFELGGFTERYGRTVLEETVLLVLMQSFATSSVPEVGAYVRELLAEMYTVLLERTGATPEQARDYMARALFLNAVLAMGYREHMSDHPWVEPLITATLTDPPPFILPTELPPTTEP